MPDTPTPNHETPLLRPAGIAEPTSGGQRSKGVPSPPASVVVLYNLVGDDHYEQLKGFDASSLDFEPEYDIDVTTTLDEYRAVARGLRREGYKVRLVNIKEDLGKLERLLRRNPPDVVFNLVEFLHDDPEMEQHVAALFELHEVAYTGAPPSALWLCQRKGLTKQLLFANGVETPRFHLLEEPHVPKRPKLRFPLIVKPGREDASAGIERESVVHDAEQLQARLHHAFHEFGPPILVEEFIDGPELHVSVVGNDDVEVLPPIEWDFSELPEGYPPIISFAAKWNPLHEVFHRVHSVCPPRLPKRVLKKVERIAIKAYYLTGCRDYARLDIRLDRHHHPYVLEVNPNPDLTEGVSLMESAEVGGYDFDGMLAFFVECALQRKEDIEEARAARRRATEEPRAVLSSPEGLDATLREVADQEAAPSDSQQVRSDG